MDAALKLAQTESHTHQLSIFGTNSSAYASISSSFPCAYPRTSPCSTTSSNVSSGACFRYSFQLISAICCAISFRSSSLTPITLPHPGRFMARYLPNSRSICSYNSSLTSLFTSSNELLSIHTYPLSKNVIRAPFYFLAFKVYLLTTFMGCPSKNAPILSPAICSNLCLTSLGAQAI